MAQYRGSSFLFVCQSINIFDNPNLDPNVQVYFLRTIKATVMILGLSLHLGITMTSFSLRKKKKKKMAKKKKKKYHAQLII